VNVAASEDCSVASTVDHRRGWLVVHDLALLVDHHPRRGGWRHHFGSQQTCLGVSLTVFGLRFVVSPTMAATSRRHPEIT